MLLDNVDRKLIEALMNNGRASMRQLAVKVDVALGTIANRMKRLEQEGVIQGYKVILDPAKVGWSMTIIVGLKITKGSPVVSRMLCLIRISILLC